MNLNVICNTRMKPKQGWINNAIEEKLYLWCWQPKRPAVKKLNGPSSNKGVWSRKRGLALAKPLTFNLKKSLPNFIIFCKILFSSYSENTQFMVFLQNPLHLKNLCPAGRALSAKTHNFRTESPGSFPWCSTCFSLIKIGRIFTDIRSFKHERNPSISPRTSKP